jgi:hemerythrin superfamily protein
MKATEILRQDHDRLKDLFARLGATAEADRLQDLFDELEELLIVHTQIEEELFYPAARAVNGLVELVEEAIAEHDAVDALCDDLAETDVGGPLFHGRLKALEDTLLHHLDEEENQIFPQVERQWSDSQLEDLGQRLEERRTELLEEELAGV